MTHTLCFPDYTHSILNIPNSILAHYGAKTDYPTLPVLDQELKRNYKNIVLWILDGLGTDLMKQNLSARSFLRQSVVDEISSVFPPTTTAATTTYYSGLPPITHGWVGWSPYFPEYKRCIALFTGRDNYTDEPVDIDVKKILPYPHIFNRIGKAATCTEIFPKSIRQNGCDTFAEVCQRVLKQTQEKGPQFILTYWQNPDHISHFTGINSPETKSVVRTINTEIRKLSEKLTNTLLIISADHGHVPIRDVVYIDDYPALMPCLAAPLALDDRTSSIFLKPGKEQTFLSAFHKYLSSDFILLKSKQAIQNGLFGKGPIQSHVPDFLGDYLLIAIGEKILRQRSHELVFKSCHAGLNKREMMVPLIFVRT